MESKKISEGEWKKYFDDFSVKYLKDEQPEYIEVQVLSEDMGAQHEIAWTPLKGITYDPKSDVLELQIEKLDHLISHPEEIYVNEEDNGWLTGVMVVSRDGEKSIIDIR